MSLWYCPKHGLVGPIPCCKSASLARIETPQSGHAVVETAISASKDPDRKWVKMTTVDRSAE
jgi:hypothetical protein